MTVPIRCAVRCGPAFNTMPNSLWMESSSFCAITPFERGITWAEGLSIFTAIRMAGSSRWQDNSIWAWMPGNISQSRSLPRLRADGGRVETHESPDAADQPTSAGNNSGQRRERQLAVHEHFLNSDCG